MLSAKSASNATDLRSGSGPLHDTNISKFLIDQSKERILLFNNIDQSKNALKYLYHSISRL